MFRFGSDDAMGVTKIPIRDARNLGIDNKDDIYVRSIVGGHRNEYMYITVVGTNRCCVIIDISDLQIPMGSNCVLVNDGHRRFSILCY